MSFKYSVLCTRCSRLSMQKQGFRGTYVPVAAPWSVFNKADAFNLPRASCAVQNSAQSRLLVMRRRSPAGSAIVTAAARPGINGKRGVCMYEYGVRMHTQAHICVFAMHTLCTPCPFFRIQTFYGVCRSCPRLYLLVRPLHITY